MNNTTTHTNAQQRLLAEVEKRGELYVDGRELRSADALLRRGVLERVRGGIEWGRERPTQRPKGFRWMVVKKTELACYEED